MVDFNALAGTVVQLYQSDGKLNDADALLIEEKYNLDTFGHEGATQICEGVNTHGLLSSDDNLDEFSADDQKNLISFIGAKPRDARNEITARLSAESGVSCDSFSIFFRLDDPNIPGEYRYEFIDLAKKGGRENEVDVCDLSLLAGGAFFFDFQKESFMNKANYMKTVEVPGAWPWSDPVKEQVFDYEKFYKQLLVAKCGFHFPTLEETARLEEVDVTTYLAQLHSDTEEWVLDSRLSNSTALLDAISNLRAEFGFKAIRGGDDYFLGIRDNSQLLPVYGVAGVSDYKSIITFPKQQSYLVTHVDSNWKIKMEYFDYEGNQQWYLTADCSALLRKDTNPAGVEEYIYRRLKTLNRDEQKSQLADISIPISTNLTNSVWHDLVDVPWDERDDSGAKSLFPLFVQYIGLYEKIIYSLPS